MAGQREEEWRQPMDLGDRIISRTVVWVELSFEWHTPPPERLSPTHPPNHHALRYWEGVVGQQKGLRIIRTHLCEEPQD